MLSQSSTVPTQSSQSISQNLLQNKTLILNKRRSSRIIKSSAMEISSMTLSAPKPPSSLPLSSSRSRFLVDCGVAAAFPARNRPSSGALVLGRSMRSFGGERARKGLTCNALFGLGVPELVVIAGVAALVFGPKKLPEVGKSIGKTVKSFQQAAKEFETELKAPESAAEAPAEKPTPVIEEEKQDVKIPSSKESV